MTDDLIRTLILSQPKKLKRLSVSKSQRKKLEFIKKENSVTSRDIANKFNISIECASLTLKNLYEKGYLLRAKASDVSGGDIYIYSFRYTLESR